MKIAEYAYYILVNADKLAATPSMSDICRRRAPTAEFVSQMSPVAWQVGLVSAKKLRIFTYFHLLHHPGT
jgi:hypothetical protein